MLVEQIQEDGGNKQDSVVKCSKMKRLSAFIHLLNDLFWKIFIKRPANPAVAPVVNPGDCHMTYIAVT